MDEKNESRAEKVVGLQKSTAKFYGAIFLVLVIIVVVWMIVSNL